MSYRELRLKLAVDQVRFVKLCLVKESNYAVYSISSMMGDTYHTFVVDAKELTRTKPARKDPQSSNKPRKVSQPKGLINNSWKAITMRGRVWHGDNVHYQRSSLICQCEN